MARTLTPEDFAAYLDSLPPDTESVGRAGSITGCPIAAYLLARGYDYAAVASRAIQLSRGYARPTRYIATPRWVRYFVSLVDHGTRGYRVSPDAARAAFRQAMEDTGRGDLAATI